jgi:hypothetical protein
MVAADEDSVTAASASAQTNRRNPRGRNLFNPTLLLDLGRLIAWPPWPPLINTG